MRTQSPSSSQPDLPRRRFAQQAAAGVAAVSTVACATPASTRIATALRPTLLLVHGAWYGGWCWRKLRPLLTAAGCDVHTPTLTGLGEREHLGCRNITLQTHVQDLQAAMQMEDLRDVVLVGHSYGGVVISLLAERERARIRQLVYLDAFVPESGKRIIDYLLPLERREAIVKLGTETGYVPPVPATALGVTDPADLAWVNARVVKQPFATFNEPVKLAAAAGANFPRAYLACVEPTSGSFGQFATMVRNDPTWTFRELRTGHNAMVIAPQLLADALLELNERAQR
jgi:pimeloyl-ACP methyl ester carboxylesterase